MGHSAAVNYMSGLQPSGSLAAPTWGCAPCWYMSRRWRWRRWQAVSLRLDADVLAWLKKDGQGYQTRANQILRERMLKDLEGR
jgi:hypothetical protein